MLHLARVLFIKEYHFSIRRDVYVMARMLRRFRVPISKSQTDWEMTMVMPLGALANQLVKIEGDLRFLSMKAAEHSGADDSSCAKSVDARLELIYDVLESIHSILGKLQADLHPKGTALPLKTREAAAVTTRKPPLEQDD
jgi:hypothetical protein